MLEKKEQEIFERLKNTYDQQDQEMKKMQQVMVESQAWKYSRKPASPAHNKMRKTMASTDFQVSPKNVSEKSDKPDAVSEKSEEKAETPKEQPKKQPVEKEASPVNAEAEKESVEAAGE